MEKFNNKTFGQYEEHDLNDLIYYSQLSAEEKLNYLEKLVKSLHDIMPDESKKLAIKLKNLGFN